MKDLTGKYEFEFEEGAVVNFSRITGTRGYTYSVEFTTSTAAIRALSIITEGVANRLGVPVENVLCKLATVVLTKDPSSVTPFGALPSPNEEGMEESQAIVKG